MGNLHSASGITRNRQQLGTKAQRRAAAEQSFKKQPRGVRCSICNHYFLAKLQPVRRADGMIVPGCPRCARVARTRHSVTASPASERPTVITPRRPARSEQDGIGALGLLMRAAFTRSGDLLALPAPSMNAQMRPVRLQLALMVGPRPRHIDSGPAIALGPGDRPSPYQPQEIEKWRDRFICEMGEAIELAAKYATADGNMTEREKHHLNWDMTNAAQRMQHTAFVFANLVMAV